ncbi:GPW/gp25 family protein [Tenacibaculum maritimum]|uniref:GPW/gp25 family protein n=1 Tax=Tenacibaculum maritimum TaxID=107401 RepID=UPI00387612AF
MNYIKLPLDFSQLTKGISVERCSKEESIAQNIMMIITSRYGEIVGREDYGSDIWELEFSQLVKINEWEEQVRLSLYASIKKYEERLRDIEVGVVLSEVDDDLSNTNNSQVRRKAKITINAVMVENDIPFNFSTLLYISPLSQ